MRGNELRRIHVICEILAHIRTHWQARRLILANCAMRRLPS